MTRALVLYAHPVPESFGSALHERVVTTLRGRGWDVDDCDLYAEGFQPVLTRDERLGYHDLRHNTEPVQGHVARLRAAEALVLVFPVWNFGYPAILKGYLDRVFLPGTSFVMEDGRPRGNLHNIRKLAAVTTYGADALRAFMVGNPPKRCVTRHLRAVMHPAARSKYLALYGMNRATGTDRARFLDRVEAGMKAL